ncbi:pyridoxal phosphate-dependent transferase [Chaetomium strumarium]|uniref:Pyridoxal phosphate-dependent transferase n=1 Tax=Chaetomium strumarium TaxID=1170767 RepID=A0AAJ0M1P7_9PEZI|nr:pyridoxal phosphate-dependent transferase [Chaetomium strumarium]
MNGIDGNKPLNRADEVERLIDAVKALIIPFIRAADEAVPSRAAGELLPNSQGAVHNALIDSRRPEDLVRELSLRLPQGEGLGEDGLLQTISDVLKYSVNTWDQGFMDKLYASTNPVGVISELLLGVLNSNVHVYQVSPALTVIEKHTAKTLAGLFGFTGPRAGGVTCQGGSSSNLTSIVIARNTLYPECKTQGNSNRSFVLFTSVHGHYSVEKAAVTCGLGSSAVWTVPVDARSGRMDASALRSLVQRAQAEGKTPLYVNATAGTTVLGSYDPFEAIAAVCKEFGLWLHIDASWGGPAIFSAAHRHKLRGCHLANSLTVNPHKMMNVPVTCSFLLGPDTAVFHRANTLPAGYLFHSSSPSSSSPSPPQITSTDNEKPIPEISAQPPLGKEEDVQKEEEAEEVWDLADLTLQCGRRADSLKLALSWIYHGAAGFERQVDHAFAVAAHLAELVSQRDDFVLVSENPPPCLQVCFYYAHGGKVAEDHQVNTARTRAMVQKLVSRGYMVDYAPGERGSFFRVVVNAQTLKTTVEGLVKALVAIGREVVG